MAYKTWATSDVPTAADFNNMFGDASQALVTTTENTTGTSYGDLATSGPAVTLSLVNGQQALVWCTARAENDTAGAAGAAFSFAVTGATTLAADDDRSAEIALSGANAAAQMMVVYLFTAGATGSHTFTMKYKRTGSGTATFRRRRIVVRKW
jgi:hypothetical protein